MSQQDQHDQREQARSACVWEATVEGAHYGLYGLAAGLIGVMAAHNLLPSFRTLNASAKTALVFIRQPVSTYCQWRYLTCSKLEARSYGVGVLHLL